VSGYKIKIDFNWKETGYVAAKDLGVDFLGAQEDGSKTYEKKEG